MNYIPPPSYVTINQTLTSTTPTLDPYKTEQAITGLINSHNALVTTVASFFDLFNFLLDNPEAKIEDWPRVNAVKDLLGRAR